jgi:hypothetical protein
MSEKAPENAEKKANCPFLTEEMEPTYYAQCGYYWPEFFDKGAFVYSEVRFCSYKKKLDCKTLEEAQKIVDQMNRDEVCPVCGKRGKFKATTDFDMYNEQRIIDGIINNAVNGR